MSSSLNKTIQRTEEKIANGQYYEAHQGVRTVVARYVRQKSYDNAIQLLYSSAQQLIKAGQPGSGSDLVLYLIQIYRDSNAPVDSTSRGRLAQLLNLFDVHEPTLKKIGQEITAWSSSSSSDNDSTGKSPYGDPELHHVLGSIFAKADETSEAERHLLLGTSSSPQVLSRMLYEWYMDEHRIGTAGLFVARGVLGYLTLGNVRDAVACWKEFERQYETTEDHIGVTSYTDEPAKQKINVYPNEPLMDFVQLLLLTCRYKNADLYRRLRVRYSQQVSVFDGALTEIGRVFFGIEPQRNNMLQGLMGSLLGGGM